MIARSGRYVREARRNAGLSRAELAARSGVSRGTIEAIEAGERDPRFKTVLKLLRACGYDIELEPTPDGFVDRAAIRQQLQYTLADRLRSAVEEGRNIIPLPADPRRKTDLELAELSAVRDELEGVAPNTQA